MIPSNYRGARASQLISRHIKCLDRIIQPCDLLKNNKQILPIKIGRSDNTNNSRLLQHISNAMCQGSIPPVILHKFRVDSNVSTVSIENNILNKCVELGGKPLPMYNSYPHESKETYFIKVEQLKKLIEYINTITTKEPNLQNIYKWAECKRIMQRIKKEEGIKK